MKTHMNALIVREDLIDTSKRDNANAMRLRNKLMGVSATSLEQNIMLVLDRSGSMENDAAAVIRTTRDIIQNPALACATFSMIVFDDKIARIHDIAEYRIGGSTALYEATEQGILITQDEVTHDHNHVFILTDGGNNEPYERIDELLALMDAKRALGWRFYLIKFGGYNSRTEIDNMCEISYTSDLPALMSSFTEIVQGALIGERLALPERI
jgi:Mg-chelatase subunit ChlD